MTINCIRQLALHGVLHGDIRLPRNFIIREDGRVFVFDFAFASIRENGVSDEEWNAKVTQMEEELLLKIFLMKKDCVIRLLPSHMSSMAVNRFFNREVENSRESWIDNYYESVDDPDDFDYRVDDNGEEYRFYLPNWKLKQDMVSERKSYLQNLDSCPLTNNSE